MLAAAGAPPAGPGWAFEFKWDGVRAVTAVAGDLVRAHSRRGNEVTRAYPELAELAELLDGRPALLDGEVVALDAAGRPDFGMLQHRMHVRAPARELVERIPVSYVVFDLLHLDGTPLLTEPYHRRRELLEALGLAGSRVRVPPGTAGVAGSRLLEVARAHGLEGVVGKRRSSRYEPGKRSPAWVKTALLQTQEVVVGGWTAGEGRRSRTLGALLLGAYDERGDLRYLGHVGTGFTESALRDLLDRLLPLEQRLSPFDEEVPRDEARRARWVRPALVGEVVYRVLTREGRIRHAAWRGLRADKDPGDARLYSEPS
ncbi:non-homologous end-joining DNA ligase [Pseudonocardia nigra]|uniref:non-homologous end-joining DNA ligase n=1 Tax=Pseudonocardia nigra TaxID=1921578 RepID=UPI001C606CA1|nr:non-homologous end-joining DNA ligase [Pseudonocardia nigra]